MKLNLGAADRHFDGYVSVDWILPKQWKPPIECQHADLTHPRWPWDDSSVDEILAFDIFEHLPNRILSMNESWRVLKLGGLLKIEVPNAVRDGGAGFVQDPTHVSPWCMNSFQYFENGSPAHARFAQSYGIKSAFDVVELTEVSWQEKYEITWKIKATLRAVK